MELKENIFDYFLLKKINQIDEDDKKFIALKEQILTKYTFKLTGKDEIIYVYQEYFNCLVLKTNIDGKALEFARYVRIKETEFN